MPIQVCGIQFLLKWAGFAMPRLKANCYLEIFKFQFMSNNLVQVVMHTLAGSNQVAGWQVIYWLKNTACEHVHLVPIVPFIGADNNLLLHFYFGSLSLGVSVSLTTVRSFTLSASVFVIPSHWTSLWQCFSIFTIFLLWTFQQQYHWIHIASLYLMSSQKKKKKRRRRKRRWKCGVAQSWGQLNHFVLVVIRLHFWALIPCLPSNSNKESLFLSSFPSHLVVPFLVCPSSFPSYPSAFTPQDGTLF